MIIKVKNTCISLIYVFSFVFALTYIVFCLTNSYNWRIISSTPIFLVIFLSLIYFICKRYIRVEVVGILLVLMTLYELMAAVISKTFIIPNVFMDVIAWPLLFLVFLDYSKEHDVQGAGVYRITVVGMMLICALVVFVLVRLSQIGRNGNALFATYFAFSYLPFVFLFCGRKTSVFFGAIVLTLTVFSLKRAAFIIVVVGISVYYIIDSYIAGEQRVRTKRIILTIVLLIFMGLFTMYLINKYNIGILGRLSSAVDDGGSGRTRIWSLIIHEFKNSNIVEKIFGHGFHYVYYELRPFGIARFAHNSLLEILFDYGIIGLFFLGSFIVYLLSQTFRMVKTKSTMAPVMCFTMVSMIVLTAISYFFEQSVMTIPHVMIWGICIGRFVREKNQKYTPENGHDFCLGDQLRPRSEDSRISVPSPDEGQFD